MPLRDANDRQNTGISKRTPRRGRAARRVALVANSTLRAGTVRKRGNERLVSKLTTERVGIDSAVRRHRRERKLHTVSCGTDAQFGSREREILKFVCGRTVVASGFLSRRRRGRRRLERFEPITETRSTAGTDIFFKFHAAL